jgi:hypothetical protein
MAKANFRQQKRQKELARKERQDERLRRRGEAPVVDAATSLTTSATKPASGPT